MRKKGFMTIGYGNMNVNLFIERLLENRVNCIVDVRTRPYSLFNVSFNKEELRDRLADNKISYFWLGNKLGGKYDRISLCNEYGIVDYEKVAETEKFKDGINELLKLCNTRNVCLMCSEKEPMRCHRFLLISRYLKEYNIYHILPDGKLIKNADLETNLLSMYGSVDQISMFDDENSETLEQKAYRDYGFKTAYISEKVQELLESGITEDLPEKTKVFCIGTEGKDVEEFFGLLKDHKVRKVIDIRRERNNGKAFARYPDITYYLKLNGIEYERLDRLLPQEWMEYGYDQRNVKRYAQFITENKSILNLLSEDLEGVCFLGTAQNYKYCYREIILKELKKNNKNITVRHLR